MAIVIQEPFLTEEEIQSRYDKKPVCQLTDEEKQVDIQRYKRKSQKEKEERVSFQHDLQALAVNPDIEVFA